MMVLRAKSAAVIVKSTAVSLCATNRSRGPRLPERMAVVGRINFK